MQVILDCMNCMFYFQFNLGNWALDLEECFENL